jgi:inner membrane protease subunit 1
LQVPKGHVWLLGDNIDNSLDSRTYGPVPLGLILGRVCYKVSVVLSVVL